MLFNDDNSSYVFYKPQLRLLYKLNCRLFNFDV